VSHDREFLDNVVTSTIVFEEDGKVQEYVGGYQDWLRQGHQLTERDNPVAVAARQQKEAERRKNKKPSKLSYKDQRELDQLPAEIETIEAGIADLQEAIAAPDFYAQEQDAVQAKLQELAGAEAKLESRVERWGELESLQDAMQAPD